MDWAAYDLAELAVRHARLGESYLAFLKVPSLNAGLYKLAAGAVDLQEPHDEDELYYVISGRADFRVGGSVMAVRTGSVIYVRATVRHRFENIEEDLTTLVFFASYVQGR